MASLTSIAFLSFVLLVGVLLLVVASALTNGIFLLSNESPSFNLCLVFSSRYRDAFVDRTSRMGDLDLVAKVEVGRSRLPLSSEPWLRLGLLDTLGFLEEVSNSSLLRA